MQALFPNNGADWNDYVVGSERLTATNDFACIAAAPPCLHGGERRVVKATGKVSCAGLTASDDLGAFNWACDDSTGTTNLVSTGLADGMYLSDLLDFMTPGFLPNAVTVFENGVAWGETPSDIWWNNPVVVNNMGGDLTTASTIYLVTNDPNPPAVYSIGDDRVAMVIQPGVTVGPGAAGDVITASAHDYLWIEGNVEASAGTRGVALSNVRFSVLRNLESSRASTGVLINASTKNRLSDITASNSNTGISLGGSSNNNTLTGITVVNNSIDGVFLTNSSNNTLLNVISNNNGVNGVHLMSSSGNMLLGVTVSSNDAGVTISSSSDNGSLILRPPTTAALASSSVAHQTTCSWA